MTVSSFTSLRRLFDDPPRDFSPTPLWWWSGAEVTRERLEWQMRAFAEGGIFNLVVINLAPAGPIYGAAADDPAWFSETWWERFIQTCELARELGMKIWFYDQIGFSGANIQGRITHEHPEAAGRALRSRTVEVRGGSVALSERETLVAAYTSEGLRVETAPAGAVDGTEGESVRIVVSAPTAYDYLSEHAVGLLMATIHGEFERRVPQYLGNVIAGSFQDELPATNSWTDAFAEEFLTRRGYDLLDHLPALFEHGGDEAAKVRGDYYAVRGELTERALFRPLGEWHAERGMLIGSDQSNPARAGFPTQATQLYTDYFRTHRHYGAAGSDHEGDAKVHSSMAHLYGHERVWIESFHSSGWGGTLEDTYDWLIPFLRSGANLYNPHASYFGTAGGWFEWAPPSTDWRQPYWEHYPEFSAAIARIASIMSWGTYSADVAVLHPTATSQALVPLDAPIDHFGDGQLSHGASDSPFAELDETQRHYLELSGVNNWFTSRPGALDSAGISFDVIDDDSIQRSDASTGRLEIAGLSYRAIVLPSSSVMEHETARRLIELLDAGGRVIVVGRMPRIAAGRGGDDDIVASLASHSRLERTSTTAEASAVLGAEAGYATSDVPLLVRRDGDEAVALVTGAFPNASAYPLREYGGAWLWKDYDFDPSRYADEKIVRVAAVVAEAEIWNPATGTRVPADVRVVDGASQIRVPLERAPAVIVVWREGEASEYFAPKPESRPASEGVSRVQLNDGWNGTLVPTIDNTWGDLSLPLGQDLTQLQIWSMDWAEGDEPRSWQTVKAGYGNVIQVSRTVPIAELPEPLDPDAAAAVLRGERALTSDEEGWTSLRYSSSRAVEKPGYGTLGLKGLVPEEFVTVSSPAAGQGVRLRGIVETGHRGAADLIIGAGAPKRAWWNGIEVATGDGYLATIPVVIDSNRSVFEIELGENENIPTMTVDEGGPTLGSFFSLAHPDGFGVRPTFMQCGEDVTPDGTVAYREQITVPADAVQATLVVGAATGLTISIDGSIVARQEKVEYYEGSWGANPMYFQHDVTALLTIGTHDIEIVADSADSRDVVYVDLVAETKNGTAVLVSGAGWHVTAGGADGTTIARRGGWGELATQHAARRPHPLPETAWLGGEPVDGRPVLKITTMSDIEERTQSYRIALPAGTASVELPLRVSARAQLAGEEIAISDGTAQFEHPLSAPAVLEILTEPTVSLRGAAAWSGPIRVTVASAPIEIGDWRAIGLGSWSGAVRYERELHVEAGAKSLTLDLGRVRGSATIEVDGETVARLFCAPFRAELLAPDPAAGQPAPSTIRVTVTVYNTIAPFLDETTPTSWTFPSQLVSGVLGPVTLQQVSSSAPSV